MTTAGEIFGNPVPRRITLETLDFFIEPDWTVDLLLDAEDFPATIWDPACGSGTIVKRCIARGLEAVGSDIAGRAFGGVQDFLAPEYDFINVATIMCNPPYKIADQFITRALTVATNKVAMLVQAKFPYSQRRHALFSKCPPARLYFLSTRPSMPPGEKLLAGTVEAKGGKLDYLWMVWDSQHSGPTECRWLRKSPPVLFYEGRKP